MELFPLFREFPFVMFSPSGVPLNYSRETKIELSIVSENLPYILNPQIEDPP